MDRSDAADAPSDALQAFLGQVDQLWLPSPALPEEVPFGRFRLRRVLGMGTFGIVYLAEDPLHDRLLALKVPRPEVLLIADLRRRFLREARAAVALRHPNLLPVVEAGAIGPIYYLATPFIDGPTLEGWLAQCGGRVAAPLAARLTADLTDGMGHAHACGVLHCDLKPANILMAPPGPGEALPGVRITDFGLSRLAGHLPSSRERGILGTAAYMAPEQARGRRDALDARTDVYALGVLLYQMLAGRPPFIADSAGEVHRLILSREPPSPRQWGAAIPPGLEAVCLRCLRKEPADRYTGCAELAADLSALLRSMPLSPSAAVAPLRR